MNKQSKLVVMSGLEWWAYETVKDLVAEAISVAQGFEQMMGWEEWSKLLLRTKTNIKISPNK